MQCAFCLCKVESGKMSADGMVFCDDCATLDIYQCDDCGYMADGCDLPKVHFGEATHCPECLSVESFVAVEL